MKKKTAKKVKLGTWHEIQTARDAVIEEAKWLHHIYRHPRTIGHINAMPVINAVDRLLRAEKK